jgi:2-polyprenyl-3-methyl-5-hydroxy-6-metoxy-1,4-benzoquinol methylase
MSGVYEGSECYLEQRSARSLESFDQELDGYLRRIAYFIELGPAVRFFEVGVGTGWVPVLLGKRGFRCDGIDINPYYVEHARQLAEREGLDVKITQGTIETIQLERTSYDVVFAMSVFEHVRDYQAGLRTIFQGLRRGGLLYFYSTNKFSLSSGEYGVPFYGWLPYGARKALRVWRQGPRIVGSSGIDFNQFTYPGLRRTFRRVGFSRVLDQFEFVTSEDLIRPSWLKRAALSATQRSRLAKVVISTFAPGTCFICIR